LSQYIRTIREIARSPSRVNSRVLFPIRCHPPLAELVLQDRQALDEQIVGVEGNL